MTDQDANAKKALQESRAEQAKNYEEGRPKGKPTPTQDELDLHALGVHLDQHEDDGSAPKKEHAPSAAARPRMGSSSGSSSSGTHSPP